MRALLARRITDKLTIRELAQHSGVPAHTLNYWVRKFNAEETGPNLPALIPVRLAAPSSVTPIRVELDSGRRLVLEPGFDEEHLLRLIDLLERAC